MTTLPEQPLDDIAAPAETRKTRDWLLLGISLGYFMVLLDTTVVVVALPAIAEEFHASVDSLQWISNGYTLTFAALLLTAGALSDRLGAKQLFLYSSGAFALVSAISIAAPNTLSLVVLRGLLGLFGAGLLPTSMALFVNSYPDPAKRARAMGVWAAITGVALAAGPLIGGVLTDTLGWRAIFAVNVPVAALSIAITAKKAPATAPKRDRGLDLPGQLTGIACLGLLTYGLIAGGESGFGDPVVLSTLAAAVVMGIAFVVVERSRRGDVMLPMSLFGSSTFSAGLLAGLLVNFGLSGAMFVLSLFFQTVDHASAMKTGLLFLPLTLPTAFNGSNAGKLVAKIGPRIPATIGFVLMGAGTLLQVPFMHTSASQIGSMAGLLLLGFGISFAMPSLISAVISSVPKHHAGIGGGALNAARQSGAVLGVAILGVVIGSGDGSQHYGLAMGIAGALLLVGALVVAGFVGRRAPGTEK
ncbi:DHA2 family efflux MFS transporter permease subunit [Streptomyces mirabilis]|uniref:DHA2 family efflux MFS transporter permease subunit n=1 Tax=Streptomyces TaxID=1883 RepID=UPI0027E59EDE|nr:DHA2 family efflux MFS transporter permease subunit [Streptomyces sp. GbtcB7]